MRIIGRLGALILGLIGCAIALAVDISFSTLNRVGSIGSGDFTQTHGLIGFVLILIGVVGSILALFVPTVAAVLLLIAGIGLFFVVKGYAVLSIVFFVLAAVLAYMDRAQSRPTTSGGPGQSFPASAGPPGQFPS